MFGCPQQLNGRIVIVYCHVTADYERISATIFGTVANFADVMTNIEAL